MLGLASTASAVPLRISRATDDERFQDRPKQASQKHHCGAALFLTSFGFVAKPEIVDTGQKHFEQGGHRHQQQEDLVS